MSTYQAIYQPTATDRSPIIRELGLQHYEKVWHDMQQFNQERTGSTSDEIWVLEHKPVFTLGLNGKQEHLLNPGDIPIVHCDRGGQATYHGPGQLLVYPLIDIKRLNLGVRQLVTLLEQTMIATLANYGIPAIAKPEAPGVYVKEKKIGSIGIRIKRDCCYHGFSLNNNMDLSPFERINTCGFKGLQVTQLADFGINVNSAELSHTLINTLNSALYS